MKHSFPESGYVRLPQIIGQSAVSEEQAAQNRKTQKSPKSPREAISPVIPVSKSAWWNGVREGRYPSPVKLGPRTTVWRVEDIRAVIEKGV